MTDPFGITEEPQIDVTAYGRSAAESVYSSIQNAVNATARSRQAQRRVIGVSNLGHCREYLRFMILNEPESDERDKTPAFIGTVLGDAVEKQIKEDHPDWIIQEELIFPLPSGGNVKGHSDIIIPASAAGTVEEWQASQEEGYDGPPVYLQGVWDLKSKAELDTIKRYGPSQQQVWQVHAYAKAAIEKGLLDPEQPILLGDVYFDRSGRDVVPHGVFHVYSESVVLAIDEWVGDVSYAVLNGERAAQDKPVEWCANWCFSGDTEIITRDGIQRIGDLAGQDVEVLAPFRQGEGLTPHGGWVTAPIRYYGVAPLRKITLQRGKAKKEVFATADHKWFVQEDGRTRIATTDDLARGDHLREIRHAGLSTLTRVPFAVAQGFVFGDGTSGSTAFYPNSPKWESMKEYFSAHNKSIDDNGILTVHSTPRSWKSLPSIRDDSSFLFSWVAGYFAADGTVTSRGQASISSADRGNLEFVRSVLAIAGINAGQINEYWRKGFGKSDAPIFSMTIPTRLLPDWFFVNQRHLEKVQGNRPGDRFQWSVSSVEHTERLEAVYCAEVPEVNAFALADGILTHNCEFFTVCRGAETTAEGLITDEEIVNAVNLYGEGAALEKEGKRLKDRAKENLEGVEGSTGEYTIKRVYVNATEIAAYTRAGYNKIDIRKVPKSKKKAASK